MESKPFVFGVPAHGDNFTDREKETFRLVSNFRHGINTILISPRRWGKTSLVDKVCTLVASEELKTVRVDIFSCRSEQDFYDAFATAVIKQTSSKIEEWTENVKTFLSRFNPTITWKPNPATELTFSLNINIDSKSDDAENILQLPETIARKKGWKIVVCIDEFQQISEFRDSENFQKRLRSVWQHQTSVSYCLFGSKKHLMNELFGKSVLPFYKFGDTLFLPKIETPYWIDYIRGRFEATGKHISSELAAEICKKAENHPSYVQQLAWLVWTRTKYEAEEDGLEEAFRDLIDQSACLFEQQTANLSTSQMNFLRAVADGIQSGFNRQEILGKYRLGTSANISIIKRALLKKELVDTGNGRFFFADPVFGLWFAERTTR